MGNSIHRWFAFPIQHLDLHNLKFGHACIAQRHGFYEHIEKPVVQAPPARAMANWLPNFQQIGAFRGAKTPGSYGIGNPNRRTNDIATSLGTSVA